MKKAGAGAFSAELVRQALRIPPGRVTTYGRLARAAGGSPVLAQRVTQILGRAYEKGETRIPFHRIVYTDGRVWLEGAHAAERLKLYKKEGIEIEDGRIKDFRKVLIDL